VLAHLAERTLVALEEVEDAAAATWMRVSPPVSEIVILPEVGNVTDAFVSRFVARSWPEPVIWMRPSANTFSL
jgi:hypothetical protein